MTEQVSLSLNYPKQVGPHYQCYGHTIIEGDAKVEDLSKGVCYSSPSGGRKAHYVDNGVHHYNYNVDGYIDEYRGVKRKVLHETTCDAKGTGLISRNQILNEFDNVTVKKNFVRHYPEGFTGNTEGAESIQILDNESGNYSVVRKNNAGEIVSGYEMNLKPQGRTFAQGFAGKLEKTAMKLGSIGGGKERPVLTQVVELMFNIAKKIR